MAVLHTYLSFAGKTEEAFRFYQSVFGGELIITRFSDTPQGEHLPAEERDLIMHIALPVGENYLMATDMLASAGHSVNKGNDMHMMLAAETQDEGERLVHALAEGGTIVVPYEKAPWGDHFGMLTDRFGMSWMVNFNPNSTK
ncbi:MAG: VOC family protein [Mucilaginibacter polytrichastri]|nr:VOC family protein [Mucilaginibacter polytrichastri]